MTDGAPGPAKILVMAAILVPGDQAMPLPDLEAYVAQALRDGGAHPISVAAEFVTEADDA
jgi:hypothetical protein